MAYINNSVYWIGQDGNVYLKGPGGAVVNQGKAIYPGDLSGSFTAQNGSGKATQISDPNPGNKPTAQATVAQTSSGGGGGTTYADKSNDIAQQNAGLSAVGTQTSAGQAAVDASLARIIGTYDTESAAANKSATDNTNQNKVNLTKNQQTALVNAAQGRQGLNGTLASLGALNGSGLELATRAVQKGANADLSSANDSYDTNAQAIDTALGTFTAADKERRDQATADAANAKTAVANEGAKDTLGYYQNLSNDYAAQGDKGNATKYSNLAASLFPTIASTTVPSAGPSYSAAAYTAPSLSSYLAGNSSTNVQVTPAQSGGIPGLVATGSTKKKTTSAAPALATV